jgi:hypothetical protein
VCCDVFSIYLDDDVYTDTNFEVFMLVKVQFKVFWVHPEDGGSIVL